MNVDRDHDEQIPKSGRRLIAIRLGVDRDQLEVFGDRDQGLGRIAILWNFIALLLGVDRDQGVCCSRSRLVEMIDF